MTGERVDRLRQHHRDEIDSAALYDAMASAERDARLAGVYRGLAAAERRHAARQLAIGLAAAAITFAVGRLVGVEIT